MILSAVTRAMQAFGLLPVPDRAAALVEIAWVHAFRDRWDACERAVHNLQTCNPEAVWALIYRACDYIIAASNSAPQDLPHGGPYGDALLWLIDPARIPAAHLESGWLVLCRALGDADLTMRQNVGIDEEERREAAVDLLRFAVHVTDQLKAVAR